MRLLAITAAALMVTATLAAPASADRHGRHHGGYHHRHCGFFHGHRHCR